MLLSYMKCLKVFVKQKAWRMATPKITKAADYMSASAMDYENKFEGVNEVKEKCPSTLW